MIDWIKLRIQAALLLTIAPFAVRSRFRQRFLTPKHRPVEQRPEAPLVEAMRQTIRFHPIRFTCLERAGALHRLLHRHGVPSELRIGVKPAASGIAAHAWVEYPPGNPLLDDEHRDFAVLRPPADMLR